MTRRKSTRCGGAGANPGTQPGDQIGAQGQPLVQQRTAAAAATATRPPQQGVVGLGSQQPSGRRPLPLLGMAARKSAPPNYVYSGSSSEEEEEEEEEQAPAPSRLPLLGMAARKSAPPNYVDSGSSSEEEEEVEDAPAPSRLPLLGMAARKSAPPNYVDSGSSSEEEEAAAAPRPPLQGAVQLGGQQPGRMAARKMGELAVHSSQGAARRNNRRRRQRAAASSDAATPPASAAGAAAGASGAAARLNLRDTMSLLQMLTCLDCLEETGAPRCFDTPAALMQHAVAKHGENSCGFMWRWVAWAALVPLLPHNKNAPRMLALSCCILPPLPALACHHDDSAPPAAASVKCAPATSAALTGGTSMLWRPTCRMASRQLPQPALPTGSAMRGRMRPPATGMKSRRSCRQGSGLRPTASTQVGGEGSAWLPQAHDCCPCSVPPHPQQCLLAGTLESPSLQARWLPGACVLTTPTSLADILDMLTCYACNFEGGPDFQSPAGLLQHLHAKGCCAEQVSWRPRCAAQRMCTGGEPLDGSATCHLSQRSTGAVLLCPPAGPPLQAAWVEALRRCPDCGRLFGSFQALSSHVTGKHLSELEALDEAEEQLWLEDWSSEEGSQGCARYGGMGIALGGSAEELEQRMSNCGFTDAEAFELLCQGVKPWDDDAWAGKLAGGGGARFPPCPRGVLPTLACHAPPTPDNCRCLQSCMLSTIMTTTTTTEDEDEVEGEAGWSVGEVPPSGRWASNDQKAAPPPSAQPAALPPQPPLPGLVIHTRYT